VIVFNFLSKLKGKIKKGELLLPARFPVGKKYKAWKDNLYQKDWVVYTKKPFSGVQKVVDYLARYSHRVAITNHRIQSITETEVVFQYKDYKDKAAKKSMRLDGREFLRRFCLHILPAGFRKVRKYGLVSNASKKRDIPRARKALGARQQNAITDRKSRKAKALERLFGKAANKCPCCKKGKHASPGHFASPTRPTGQAALRSIIGLFYVQPPGCPGCAMPKNRKTS
jgi:hypothetical protein